MFKVLIVDDSPAMRAVIARIIQMSGFPIGSRSEAGDGKQALEMLRHEKPDVILTDINMPIMDGVEFVRSLAADKDLRRIPVVVISTDATVHRVRDMLALGAKGYVKKPFLPEAIRDELEKVLGVCDATR